MCGVERADGQGCGFVGVSPLFGPGPSLVAYHVIALAPGSRARLVAGPSWCTVALGCEVSGRIFGVNVFTLAVIAMRVVAQVERIFALNVATGAVPLERNELIQRMKIIDKRLLPCSTKSVLMCAKIRAVQQAPSTPSPRHTKRTQTARE